MRFNMMVASALALSCVHPNTFHEARPVTDGALGPAESVPTVPTGVSCDDAPLLTLEQLAKGEGAGQRVAIDAVPEAQVMCTAKACFPSGGCCNGCGGQYVARVKDQLVVTLEGAGSCGGMDCSIHCEPFGRKPTRRYRFVGLNQFKPVPESSAIWATSSFKVEKFCVAP